MESKDILDSLVQKANARKIDLENTYVDEDGEIVCSICNRRKTTSIKLNGIVKRVNCICGCDEKKMREEELKRQEELKEMHFYTRQKSISEGYRDVYLSNSDIPLEKEENYINNFKTMLRDNIGLMFWGVVGNGKTFRASVIANELCKKGYKVMMLHTTEALSKIAHFDNEWFKEEIKNCDLLILDDFGVSRNTDYQLEQLNSLIDLRYASKKPLIITTNLSRKELADETDIRLQRTFNRLIEMTHPIRVEEEGRRKSISQERYKKIEDLLNGKE